MAIPEKRSASSPEPEPPRIAPSVCTSQRGSPAKVPLGPSATARMVRRQGIARGHVGDDDGGDHGGEDAEAGERSERPRHPREPTPELGDRRHGLEPSGRPLGPHPRGGIQRLRRSVKRHGRAADQPQGEQAGGHGRAGRGRLVPSSYVLTRMASHTGSPYFVVIDNQSWKWFPEPINRFSIDRYEIRSR